MLTDYELCLNFFCKLCLMVVTNRLWDSVDGFRFQNVILVFHDCFCAIFEDSTKKRLFIVHSQGKEKNSHLLVVIFLPFANVVDVDVRFTAAPFPFMAMPLLLLNESLKNESKLLNGWNIGIEIYWWPPRVAGTVELKSVNYKRSLVVSLNESC